MKNIYKTIIENIINNYNSNNINYNILTNLCDIIKLEKQNLYIELNKMISDSNDYLLKLNKIQEKLTIKHQFENVQDNNNLFYPENNNNFSNNNNYNLKNRKINNNNNIQNNISDFQEQNPQIFLNKQINDLKSNSYIFPIKGLKKHICSSSYLNMILQCLLHVNELTIYFIIEYPEDQQNLAKINSNAASGGDISRAFFNLVIGITKKESNKQKTKKKSIFNFLSDFAFSSDYSRNSNQYDPLDFKRTLELHYPNFKAFEENDLKDLMLYLLQTMHQELNYNGNINKRLKYIPNQNNMFEAYKYFIANYNTNNFSKISLLFYGTYKNKYICLSCKKELYIFNKFEFITFSMSHYHNKKFNIFDGFRDNSNPNILNGDNQFLCNNCNKLQDAENTCKIFESPLKLLINIDYGKNKKYLPSSIEFDEEIDITNFVDYDYKEPIKYKIIGVFSYYRGSGENSEYIAFCKNKETGAWFKFNDSFYSECNENEIYEESPYFLLYERIFNKKI